MTKENQNQDNSTLNSGDSEGSMDAIDAIFASFRRSAPNSCLRFNLPPESAAPSKELEALDSRTVAYIHSRLPKIYAEVAAETEARRLREETDMQIGSHRPTSPSPR